MRVFGGGVRDCVVLKTVASALGFSTKRGGIKSKQQRRTIATAPTAPTARDNADAVTITIASDITGSRVFLSAFALFACACFFQMYGTGSATAGEQRPRALIPPVLSLPVPSDTEGNASPLANQITNFIGSDAACSVFVS